MIFTNLNDGLQNKALSLQIQKCLEFSKKEPLVEYTPGSYEIPNEGIKFNVLNYETKSENESFWESHLKYIDVQIMLKGSEYIAFNNIHNMEEETRNIENDFIKHKGKEMYKVLITDGDVLVFFPEDVHMPGLSVEKSENIVKVVFKIDVNTL